MPEPTPSTKFSLVIVSPDKVLFEGEAVSAFVPGIIQELAILPDHTPLYAELNKGTIKITQENGKTQDVLIEKGVMRVKQNKVSIILGFSE